MIVLICNIYDSLNKNILMRQVSVLFLLLILISFTSIQSVAQRTCGTKEPSPDWDKWFNSKVNEYKTAKASARGAVVNFTIPVVIHVLHNGDAVGTNENISYLQIQSAIKALNDDFSGTNSDIVNVPQVFQNVKAGNTGISFCLAQVNPSGTILSEPGVERINILSRGWTNPGSILSRGSFFNYINSTIKPSTIWDPSKYLNVWLVDVNINMTPSRLLGYATFPLGSGLSGIQDSETASTSGLVIRYDTWGTIGNLDPSFNKNRTATHEIGHWLGLRHIWGDRDDCSGDDYCGDTPPQKTKNFGCKTHPYNLGVCSGNNTGEMFMNFMDYGNDPCIIMFTQDQVDRMQTAMLNGVYRNPLTFSNACQTPAIVNDIKLNNFVTPSSSIIEYGTSFTVSTNFVNRGNAQFSGDFGAAVFDENNNFISFIETLTNNSLEVNNTYVNDKIFSTTGISEMIPGNYTIGVFYKPSEGSWLQCGDNGSYVNLVPITVINTQPIELYSSINLSTGTTLTQGESSTITVDLTNTGNTTFTGQYEVNLYNLDGSFSENINTVTESDGLPPDYHYPPYLSFSKNSILSSPGEYFLGVVYKSTSQSDFKFAGSTTSYFNPIRVKVVAPSPDKYEINNTFSKSYSLPINFSDQAASVTTSGSNFHISSDEDYYKVNLAPGYKYTISARLHDSYESGNGIDYSADAKFTYSTDEGVTWSTEIDDILSTNIIVTEGRTLYFHVLPYYENETGTYLLDVSITRTICQTPVISYTGSTSICSASPITLTSSSSTNNQWYLNNVAIPNATSSSYVAAAAGSYTLVTSVNNCTSTPSSPVVVTIRTPANEICGNGIDDDCDGIADNVFRFTGNGNFSNSSNWECGLVPANPLPAKYMIMITPQVNGKCIMDIQYKVSAGAKLTVTKGSNLILPNNLKIE